MAGAASLPAAALGVVLVGAPLLAVAEGEEVLAATASSSRSDRFTVPFAGFASLVANP